MTTPHRCDEHCVCPDHGTPMWWSAKQKIHACQDLTCRYAPGLENHADHALDAASRIAALPDGHLTVRFDDLGVHTTGLTTATRRPVEARDVWEWSGTANGCTARHLTTDPTLTLYIRPVFTQHAQGVELVDKDGNRVTFEVRDPRAR